MTEQRLPVRTYASRGEYHCHRAERQSHANRSDQQQRPAADTINEHYRRDRGEYVDQAGEQINAQGPLFRCPRCFPQDLAVIKDDIDTDKLLKSRQTHPDPKHWSDTSRAWNNEIRQTRAMFPFQALLDLPHQFLGIGTNASEDFTCSTVFATENKIARRLRDQHCTYQKRGCWQSFHQKHPAPSRRPTPEDRASSVSKPGQDVVAQKGAEQPSHNRHLLQ